VKVESLVEGRMSPMSDALGVGIRKDI